MKRVTPFEGPFLTRDELYGERLGRNPWRALPGNSS